MYGALKLFSQPWAHVVGLNYGMVVFDSLVACRVWGVRTIIATVIYSLVRLLLRNLTLNTRAIRIDLKCPVALKISEGSNTYSDVSWRRFTGYFNAARLHTSHFQYLRELPGLVHNCLDRHQTTRCIIQHLGLSPGWYIVRCNLALCNLYLLIAPRLRKLLQKVYWWAFFEIWMEFEELEYIVRTIAVGRHRRVPSGMTWSPSLGNRNPYGRQRKRNYQPHSLTLNHGQGWDIHTYVYIYFNYLLWILSD